MVTGNNNNDVDGNSATVNEVDDYGDGVTRNVDDDDDDGDNDDDGDGATKG